MEDWNRTTEDILICVKPDGSLEYMYYEDFEKKVQDKELSFLIDWGCSDYDDNVEYAADVQTLEPESSDFKQQTRHPHREYWHVWKTMIITVENIMARKDIIQTVILES